MFAGNTPVPLPLAAAASASLAIMRKGGRILRARLGENTNFVKEILRSGGVSVSDFPTPVIPLIPATSRERERVRRALLEAGVYPSFIQYPGAPKGGYYRFVISSEHDREQLEALADGLIEGTGRAVREESDVEKP
jgi:7-keto-8-aminopelargonate synthetase-like enzyme